MGDQTGLRRSTVNDMFSMNDYACLPYSKSDCCDAEMGDYTWEGREHR